MSSLQDTLIYDMYERIYMYKVSNLINVPMYKHYDRINDSRLLTPDMLCKQWHFCPKKACHGNIIRHLIQRDPYVCNCNMTYILVRWNLTESHYKYIRMVLVTRYSYVTDNWRTGNRGKRLFTTVRLLTFAWWRHQMETFSALLVICAGNSPVPGEFPAQRPVTRSFGVFFDLHLNIRLSKQSWGWWFETSSSSLWRHWNDNYYSFHHITQFWLIVVLLLCCFSFLCDWHILFHFVLSDEFLASYHILQGIRNGVVKPQNIGQQKLWGEEEWAKFQHKT